MALCRISLGRTQASRDLVKSSPTAVTPCSQPGSYRRRQLGGATAAQRMGITLIEVFLRSLLLGPVCGSHRLGVLLSGRAACHMPEGSKGFRVPPAQQQTVRGVRAFPAGVIPAASKLQDEVRANFWTRIQVLFRLHYRMLNPDEGISPNSQVTSLSNVKWEAIQRPTCMLLR